MAEIRHATAADIPALIALGRVMHAEAPSMRHAAFSAAKVGAALEFALNSGLILVHEGRDGIDAGFAGLLIERWFSHDRYLTDLALFVRPDHRGGVIAYRLLSEVLKWCQAQGLAPADVVLGITTGVHIEQTEKLYGAVGFERVGGLFQLRSY